MAQKELMIAIEAPEEETAPGFSAEVEEAEAADKEMYAEVSPKGRFSSKSLNPLVKASNMLLPAFGQEATYPEFDTGVYETWPEDFVRIFSMFSAASRDAATEDVISPELVVDFENATSDNDVQMLAGKVQALSKSKPFKTWLKAPKEITEPEPVEGKDEPEGKEMSEDEIDNLFMNRL
jgi:hypothetical protein